VLESGVAIHMPEHRQPGTPTRHLLPSVHDEHMEGDGETVFRHACKFGRIEAEGLFLPFRPRKSCWFRSRNDLAGELALRAVIEVTRSLRDRARPFRFSLYVSNYHDCAAGTVHNNRT
jgi:hypothetical protein